MNELKRGFTEGEFWQAVTEVAGRSLSEIRRLVDTTEEPDYDRLLAPAGLCIDKANWMIRCVENPDASQLAFQKSMGL